MRAWFAAWLEAEQDRFLLLLPVAMGAAILVYFALPREPPLWLGFAAIAGAAASLVALMALSPRQAGGRPRAGGRTRFCPGGMADRR